MPGPIRLALANDYEIVVRGLAATLEPHRDRIEIVDLAVDEPVEAAAHVALFDVFGSGEVHTGDIRRILDSEGVQHVAVFTWNLDDRLIRLALGAGVRGYLSKGLTGAELADAIERIAGGAVVVARPEGEPGVVEAEREAADAGFEPPGLESVRSWPGKAEGLPEREAEVLGLVVQGYDNDAIAERLYISVNTVKTRLRNLYRRMGFQNRVEAAVWGVHHGFETDTGVSSQTRTSLPL